jgi:putative SOS response-associated peptidase YedK
MRELRPSIKRHPSGGPLLLQVILPEQHHPAWLGETDDGNLKALLVPYPADQMRMWEILPG